MHCKDVMQRFTDEKLSQQSGIFYFENRGPIHQRFSNFIFYVPLLYY
jgi:hypothetical protein